MSECVGVCRGTGTVWRNNGDGSFTVVDIGIANTVSAFGAIGTDYNNDRAVDLLVPDQDGGTIFQNPREGPFLPVHPFTPVGTQNVRDVSTVGVSVLDFNHDGWMDVAFTYFGVPAISLWRNDGGKKFDEV